MLQSTELNLLQVAKFCNIDVSPRLSGRRCGGHDS